MGRQRQPGMKSRLAAAVIVVIGIAGAALAMSEQEKIAALLEAVGKSNLTFVRNGVPYSSARARDHLAYKLKRAGGRVATAEDFINHIAGRSSTTGMPYYIVLEDGTRVEAEAWLRKRLEKLGK